MGERSVRPYECTHTHLGYYQVMQCLQEEEYEAPCRGDYGERGLETPPGCKGQDPLLTMMGVF